MRLGRVHITRRFYLVLVAVILVIIFVVSCAPKAPVQSASLNPAFPASELSTPTYQKAGWSGNFISTYTLFYPASETDFLGSNYSSNLGLPVQFKIYLFAAGDAASSRPDLVVSTEGYTFEPAVFLPPDQTAALSDLEGNAGSELSNRPVELGFRNGATPPPGNAYEVTGVLWWRSDELDLQTSTTQITSAASPVVLVDSYTQLSPAELSAPTTQRVDLGLNYQENGQTVDINQIQWSAGNELRVCLSVTNNTAQTTGVWPGLSSMTADNGQGAVTGTPDPTSPLASASQLLPYQTIPGDIVFPASVSDPTQPLTLRMPTLPAAATEQSTAQDSIIINIPQSAIRNVASSSAPTSDCD